MTFGGVALDRCVVQFILKDTCPVDHHNLRTRCSISFSCSETFSPQKGQRIHVTLGGVVLDR